MTELREIGIITSAHALKGEVKVVAYTQTAADLLKYQRFQLRLQNPRLPSNLTVKRGRVINQQALLIQFAEIQDRTMAEQFRQVRLWVTEAEMQQVNGKQLGEYYQYELVGMRVKDAEGNELGTVSGIGNYGAGDVVEIAAKQGIDFSLPFNAQFILKVDLVAKEMTVTSLQLFQA